MNNRICTAAGAATVLAASVLTAAPASAADSPGVSARYSWPYPGVLEHRAPDRGYDAPIAVRCMRGVSSPLRVRRIAEGETSSDKGCFDVEEIYVAIGQEVTCTSRIPFVDDWTIRGNGLWRNFRDNLYTCTNGLR